MQAAKEMALRMDAYAPQGSTSQKADRKNRQVHNIEEGGGKDKNKQKALTKEEVNALLAAEQKKWEKAKNKEINEQNRRRNEKAKAAKEKTRKEDKVPVIYVKGNIISEIALTWLVCAKGPEEEVWPVRVKETRGLGCCAYTLLVPGR